MLRRTLVRHLVFTTFAGALFCGLTTGSGAQTGARTFKAAFFNIKSGLGQVGLSGSSPFADTYNCTNPALAMNAWGVGFVQAELRASVGSDPSIVVLGVAEAWRCATPQAIQEALGWASRTGEENGLAVIARYGFAGPERWMQLDTSLNVNPEDDKWAVRVPVCLDAGCSRSVYFIATHWGHITTVPANHYLTAQKQAQQTMQLMTPLPGDPAGLAYEPHAIMGDLNVAEGQTNICDMAPSNVVHRTFRAAGYLDAWRSVHGLGEGFTGMWSRRGCGVPEGYLFKRIDYAWSKNLGPMSMKRFGMVAAGAAAPSDHAGIIAEFAVPDALIGTLPPAVNLRTPADNTAVAGTVTAAVDASDDLSMRRVELMIDGATHAVDTTAPYTFAWNTLGIANGRHVLRAAATDVSGNRVESLSHTVSVDNVPGMDDEIVLHASQAADVRGSWTRVADSTAASGLRLQSGSNGILAARAAPYPSSYADFTFAANAGTGYRLWIRGRAADNSPDNDSVHVQFDGSVTAGGAPTLRIATDSSTPFILEECGGCGFAGWGWEDNGVPRDVLGPLIYFARTGPQRLRIQAREDGLAIDQIVLSAVLYEWTPPGAVRNDTTILSRTPGGPPGNLPPSVTLTSPSSGSRFTAPATIPLAATASDGDGGVARVEFYAGSTRLSSVSVPPYTWTWNSVAAGRYTITARAVDTDGAIATSAGATIDVAAPGLPAGWTATDVGSVGPGGSTTASGTTFTVRGSGADIWGAADAFHYAYRSLAGDGVITARVAGASGSDPWTKVGVMIRASTAASAPHAFMLVSAGKGAGFQRRTAAGGSSTYTSAGAYAAPRWVKLTRRGSVVTAAISADGASWTVVGSSTIALPATALFGLAVTSHDVSALATGTLGDVTVSAVAPAGWTSTDVGATGLTGSSSESAGTFVIRGAGADIWGTADAFHYVHRSLAGDGVITARVAGMSGSGPWTKVGVMIRASTAASAPNAFMLVSAGKGAGFQRRTAAGGSSTYTSAGAYAAPRWVRLTRSGSVITAAISADGASWTVVGSSTIALPATALFGLAVTSHDPSALASGTLDNVSFSD